MKKRNTKSLFIQIWIYFLIGLSILGNTILRSQIELVLGLALCSFLVPALLIMFSLRAILDFKRIVIRVVGMILSLFVFLLGLLLFLPVEPYWVRLPTSTQEVNQDILSMDFSKVDHVSFPIVQQTWVDNALLEAYFKMRGAGGSDRQYITAESRIEPDFDLFSTEESKIKPIVAALQVCGEKVNYEESVHVFTLKNIQSFLHSGDTLESLAGVPLTHYSSIQKALLKIKNQNHITMQIKRNNQDLIYSLPRDQFFDYAHQAQLQLRTQVDIQQPLLIKSTDHSITQGNSDGLAKSLEIVHQKGIDLLKGRKILATGAVQADGSITPIGGLKFKYLAAVREKFDIFLVPKGNQEEMEGILNQHYTPPDSIQIEYVSNLKEAVNLLNHGKEKR